jgi:hypothetical protein
LERSRAVTSPLLDTEAAGGILATVVVVLDVLVIGE